jgi:hypothetical protein
LNAGRLPFFGWYFSPHFRTLLSPLPSSGWPTARVSIPEYCLLAANGKRRIAMARCEVCGNEYDKSFEVRAAGRSHVFDSFECAIHALAPICDHCRCKIVGHGIEADGRFFCCANCAKQAGVANARDRV